MYLQTKTKDCKNPQAVIVRVLTVKGWVRLDAAIADDVPVKEWKQEKAAYKAAFKEQQKNPHYQIEVVA